jgi:hypothetical protein
VATPSNSFLTLSHITPESDPILYHLLTAIANLLRCHLLLPSEIYHNRPLRETVPGNSIFALPKNSSSNTTDSRLNQTLLHH